MEQLDKFPLGNHGNLGELGGAYPKDFHDFLIGFPHFPRKLLPIRHP